MRPDRTHVTTLQLPAVLLAVFLVVPTAARAESAPAKATDAEQPGATAEPAKPAAPAKPAKPAAPAAEPGGAAAAEEAEGDAGHDAGLEGIDARIRERIERVQERAQQRAEKKAQRKIERLEHKAEKDGDRVAFGSSVVIEPGEVVNDVTAFGGTVTIESGAKVTGDVAAIGGTVEIQSGVTVDGDVVAMGGSVVLRSGSEVMGDVSSMGGSIDVEEGAVIHGSRVGLSGLKGLPKVPRPPLPPGVPGSGHEWSFFHSLGRWLFALVKTTLLFLAVLVVGLLAVAFMPRRMDRMRRPLAQSPGKSFLAGLLALLALLPLFIVLLVSIIGIPIALLLPAAYAFVALLGLSIVGMAVGRRIGARGRRTPTAELVVGLMPLWILGLLGTLPWVGWLFDLVLAIAVLAGMGSVVLARFGNPPKPTSGDVEPPPPFDPGI